MLVVVGRGGEGIDVGVEALEVVGVDVCFEEILVGTHVLGCRHSRKGLCYLLGGQERPVIFVLVLGPREEE